MKLLGVKQPAIAVALVAAATFSTALWPVFLEDMTLTSSGFQWQQWLELPAEASQIYDVDTITLPFVDVLLHLEVRVGAT